MSPSFVKNFVVGILYKKRGLKREKQIFGEEQGACYIEAVGVGQPEVGEQAGEVAARSIFFFY